MHGFLKERPFERVGRNEIEHRDKNRRSRERRQRREPVELEMEGREKKEEELPYERQGGRVGEKELPYERQAESGKIWHMKFT